MYGSAAVKNPKRRSTSFTQDEVEIACDLFMGLLAGRDVSVLIHRKEYRGLTSRFLRMREALRNNKAVRDVDSNSRGGAGAAPSTKAAAL